MRKQTTHKIEYWDCELKEYNVIYIISSTYSEAISIFREDYKKPNYEITEVCKVIDADWSKY